MSDAAPAAPQEAAAPAPQPVTEAEPQGTPVTPKEVKRVNRLAQVREVVAKRVAETAKAPEAANTDAPPANENKEAVPKAPEAAKEAETAKPEGSKAKAWADVMAREQRARNERDAAKREREQVAQERAQFETERKAAQEAAELLAKDPVAYATKFGGKDFGKRLVDHSLNEKARDAEHQASRVAELDAKLERLEKLEKEREYKSQMNNYLGEHRSHWKTDKEASVLSSWYDDGEVDQVVQSIAERHASVAKEVLTPQKLARNLTHELKQRLERLAKTEQGQEFLRQFVTGATPAPAKTRPPADAPKTLSKDLTTQGTPPGDGRLRKITDKQRSDLIRQVLDRRQG